MGVLQPGAISTQRGAMVDPPTRGLLDAYLAQLAQEHGWLWCALYAFDGGLLGQYTVLEGSREIANPLQNVLKHPSWGVPPEITLRARLFAITPQIALLYVLPVDVPDTADRHQISRDVCLMLSLRALEWD